MDKLLSQLLSPGSELWQIIGVTLRTAFTSTLIACTLGGTLGVLVGIKRFPGKGAVMKLCGTLMGLPPVLSGLVVFFILSRSGPLGQYKLLYSVTAMVCAQVLLITPVALYLAATAVGEKYHQTRETMLGLGLGTKKRFLLMLGECRSQLWAIVFLGFGRAISEVGAAQLVGGNVQYKTRVMTTAIVLETNKGNFTLAVALGVLLLLIALIINMAAQGLTGGRRHET